VKAQHLHDWQMTPDQAKRVQRELAVKVSRRNELETVRLVAGVDISAPDSAGLARAAVVVLSYPELAPVETKVITKRVTFPYVPGLLSFRESPLILAVCEGLEATPDLILVDGQGIAHPRRLGLASHLGLLWDKPTIGCAKSRLCGEHKIVPAEPGSYAEITDNGEVIGAVLRTKTGVAPLYISIGHKVDLETAVSWVLRCCRGQRLPEPTRLAHLAASGHLESPKPLNTQAQMRLGI
jgi:deoxyribonuclease V